MLVQRSRRMTESPVTGGGDVMLVNMIGIEEDEDVVALHADAATGADPKGRVTLTTLVGALLSSYTSATPPALRTAATVTTLATSDAAAGTPADAPGQHWDAA